MQSYIIKTNEGRKFIVQEKHPELAAKRITDIGLKWHEITLAGDNSGESIIRKEYKDSQIFFRKTIKDIYGQVVAVSYSKGFHKFSKEKSKPKYCAISVSDLLASGLKFDPIL